MFETFEPVLYGCAIATLVGSLVAFLLAYRITEKVARFRYEPLYLFNDIMTSGLLILCWYYVGPLSLNFVLVGLLSFLYQTYKLLVGIYSVDKRFRLLVLSLGVSHQEYARFTLEKNIGRLLANMLKFYTLSLVTFFLFSSPFAPDLGYFSLIVGLVLSLVQHD